MVSPEVDYRKFWQIPIADLERELAARDTGLGAAKAAARLARYGPNLLDRRRRLSLPLKFLRRFANPLVLILLAAAGVAALTGDLVPADGQDPGGARPVPRRSGADG